MLTVTPNDRTEITFTIASEQELVEAFRYRDQKKLVLPEKQLPFPFKVRSYLTWKRSEEVHGPALFPH